jgi:hypothetical protein
MLRDRLLPVLVAASAAEAGVAGYGLGHGARWLLLAVAALTAADAARAVACGRLACLAGLEVALVLLLLAATGAPAAVEGIALLACLAWMLGPGREAAPRAAAVAGASLRRRRG